jgi:autotransporter-associated beta strand protein
MAMAELIVYERELTEREKVATRNYLLMKWFGKNDGELDPVPDAVERTLELPVLSVDGAAEISAADVKKLVGGGTLVKTGDGELTLMDVGSYTGSVVVSEGCARFKGEYRAAPKMATDGLRMRLAADEGLKLIDNPDGTRGVLEWENTAGDDWKALAPTGYVINAEKNGNISKNAPLYVANSVLNGLPVVDMPKRSCFRFVDPEGNYASVTGIRNVFWVVGSERGGGWLLGGGNLYSSNINAKYIAWHRGSNAANSSSSGTDHADCLIYSSAYISVLNSSYCAWRKNAQAISPTTATLSGGWDQLTYSALQTIEAGAKEYPGASGLAFDGRIFNGDPVNIAYSDRTGNQTLAEVLIYTNELAEAEILQTEAYLNCKWGLNNAIPTRQESVRLVVAEGASVGTESGFGAFAAIEGSGTVEGDVTAAELVADFSKSSFFTVSGTFSIPDGLKIQVRNPPADLPAEVKLLQAGGIDGWQLRKNISVAGVDADKVRVRLSVCDGALYARLTDGKLAIIVR